MSAPGRLRTFGQDEGAVRFRPKADTSASKCAQVREWGQGMKLVYLIGLVLACIGLLTQCAILWLQANALRRHGHSFFRLLVAGSVLGVLYCVLALVLYSVRLPVPVYWILLSVSSVLLVVASVLAVVGSSRLFRSYASYVAQSESPASDR